MARTIASKLTTAPACPQAREPGHDQQASRAMCNGLDPSWLSPIPLSLGGVRTHGSAIPAQDIPWGCLPTRGGGRHCPLQLATQSRCQPQSETTQGRISSGAWGSSARGQRPICEGHLPSLSESLITTCEGRTDIPHPVDRCIERLPVL